MSGDPRADTISGVPEERTGQGGAEHASERTRSVRERGSGGDNDGMGAPSGRRVGVYVCHCGGNISDYVDVEQVAAESLGEDAVVVARSPMFACSEAGQQEILEDIERYGLDGLVVASCSPKLHTYTFRGVAARGGVNPYEYTQVNVREQCSWVHTDDRSAATEKATGLVRAGIARTRLTTPLVPLVVETTPKTLVIGGGIAGLRAAIGLADIGLEVVLVERAIALGGWVGGFGEIYPHARNGRDLVHSLIAEVKRRPTITVLTRAEVVGKAGSFGNYVVDIRVGDPGSQAISVLVGSIIVATGFDAYEPSAGEFGYGMDGVVTLAEFKKLVDASKGPLVHRGRPVRSIAYVYCVGSRQPSGEGGNEYCSRYCCTAAVHASILTSRLDPSIRQFHLYRDIRTYGRYETLYTESRELGSAYLKFPDDQPPAVAARTGGGLTVTVRDLLTDGEELAIPADLVVLVTGMVARDNTDLTNTLKLPLGSDGFYNEIHPKLRPVETVVDGVLIAGACQGPKSSAESVASGLAAVTQSAAVLRKGFTELSPLVAEVYADACTACGDCLTTCPYDAITTTEIDGRTVATISEATCKGCGGCVPVCPEDAIDLRGYTDAQIRAQIDSLLEVAVA
jgi:heterodisulfide reductase subunit A